MKKTFFSMALVATLVAAMCISCVSESGQKFRLEGTVEGAANNDTLALIDVLSEDTIAIVYVSDGKITPCEGTVGEPVFAALVSRQGGAVLPIYLESGTVTVQGSLTGNPSTVAGTPLNDESQEFINRLRDMEKSLEQDSTLSEDSVSQQLEKLVTQLVERHNSDVLGFFNFMQFNYLFDDAKKQELISLLEPKFGDNDMMVALKKSMDTQATSAEGQMFIDFEAEYEGKTQRLSDYVGKGQYVLCDFWASWCGPCREEIPNLISAYNKYSQKGLVVLGVATWDKPEDTLKAISELGIPYPQIINAQKAGSDAYGIEGIPEIILFAPDGTILARGLRGEEIDKKLKVIFAD